VQAPSSQIGHVAAASGAITPHASTTLVPVGDANVNLVNVDTNQTVGHTSTDSSGNYTLPSPGDGQNYEVVATKSVGSATLTLSAIVNASSSNTTAPRNLTPDSTVAASAALTTFNAEKQTDPSGAGGDLQKIADDLEKERHDSGAPPPDLTNPTSVSSAGSTLLTANAPNGSYTGSYSGDSSGEIGGIIMNGHVMMVSMPQSVIASAASVRVAHTETTSTTTGTLSPPPPPSSTGDTTGTTTGGTTGTTSGGHHDHGEIVTGSVNVDGVFTGQNADGLKVTGIFVAGVGTGTWIDSSGKHGTWTVSVCQKSTSGLYGGQFLDSEGNATNAGHFAVLVTDDGHVYVDAQHTEDDTDHISGTGTFDGTSTVTFTWTDTNGNSGTGTGTITGTAMRGSITNGTMTELFAATNHFDPFDGINPDPPSGGGSLPPPPPPPAS
jgi:hypothetical protein